MGLFIVCRELPLEERPKVALGDIADPNDLLLLVEDVAPDWLEQDALWAAAVAAHLHGAWPRIDVRFQSRGVAYLLPDNWRITSHAKLQRGLMGLVDRGLLVGDAVRGDVRFTTATARRLVRQSD